VTTHVTTPSEWMAGARLRTWPAAVSPVLAGTGIAVFLGGFRPVVAVLALVVSISLQIGVNYANDYSDGIRGTDADRVGPMRLVGSGAATPSAVKRAAFGCFALACLCGLAVVVITQLWWLIAIGVACVLAAWFYTGGTRPYGYLGLGELFVFVFFGLVAVCGTVVVQIGRVPLVAVVVAVGIGSLACAVLVANNLRDIAGDTMAGKRTLATRMGAPASRALFMILCAVGVVTVVITAALTSGWALLAMLFVALAAPACRTVLGGASGPALIVVLKRTALAELAYAVLLLTGLLLAAAR